MGRLGFNLVRQKEGNKSVKNVESGVPDQQNERNESVELSELILTIEERNRTIKNLRLLLVTLSTVIICLCAYILLAQSTFFCNHKAVVSSINKIEESYTNRMEALQGQYDAVLSQVTQQDREKDDEKEKLRADLLSEKILHGQDVKNAEDKYEALKNSFDELQTEHDVLSAQYMETKEKLTVETKKMLEERADLIKKIDEANRKLQERSSRKQALRTTTTTTTPAPRVGLFNADSLKKFNDIVKDIETVGRIIGNVFTDSI